MSPLGSVSRWRACVAPMMKYTDRHYRYFARLMSKRVRLYTEMIVASALVRGDPERFLHHAEAESPVALQLGGSNPAELATAARLGVTAGFDEINLNIGCPSARVKSGRFGACLMAAPELVADCIEAVRGAADVPVTIKTRIGIDEHDDYEFLYDFVDRIVAAGCDAVIVHARKALLAGLSPKDNRTIPPLRYDLVYRLRRDFPAVPVIINGGISTLDECRKQLDLVDGVMIGRAACRDPFLLSSIDARLFGDPHEDIDREDVLAAYWQYVEREWNDHRTRQLLIKPLFGLFLGQPRAKAWRRWLSKLYAAGELPPLPGRQALLTA